MKKLGWSSLLLLVAVGAGLCDDPPADDGRVPDGNYARKNAPSPRLAAIPKGPFGFSMIGSEDGQPINLAHCDSIEDCAACHTRQRDELVGSFHNISHQDRLYRALSEQARAEAGPEVYAFCSGCHAPAGVAAGLIPATPEDQLPAIVKEGVNCEICHQISRLTGPDGPWREPGNASFVLSPSPDRNFGPPEGNDQDAPHPVQTREFLGKAEFCAGCHTVVHPFNGLRVEHTYEEWKSSVYAQHGIQCQDCHMHSVEDAMRTADTLEHVKLSGKSEPDGPEREIYLHTFVGGNANGDRLGSDERHAAIAEARLKSAARMEITAPASARPGAPFSFDVIVRNERAGHALPTSLTELREMWVELEAALADGTVLFRSGALDADGEIPGGTMRFGSLAGDDHGRPTYKLWEITQMLWERVIPPKGSAHDTFRVTLPVGAAGTVRLRARLLYRSASPKVVQAILADPSFTLKTVEMTTANAEIPIR